MRKRSLRRPRLTRRSFFVDPATISRARRALAAPSDAEAVRLSVERVVEMERFWRFMTATRRRLRPGSIESP
jgi:hypothetical protein